MRLAVVIDRLEDINVKKDTSLALAYAAHELGWVVYFIEYNSLRYVAGRVEADAYRATNLSSALAHVVESGELTDYVQLAEPSAVSHADLDIVLIRKDPPVDEAFWAMTYLLRHWEMENVVVANSTQALREFNEKCVILRFPELITDTVVTADAKTLLSFLQTQQTVILKPLEGMGGTGILKLRAGDAGIPQALQSATRNHSVPVMMQRVLDVEHTGDKRILLFHGKPLPYALERMPAKGEFKANLAAGGSGRVVELTERDKVLAEAVVKRLPIDQLGLMGLDVIDGCITEINVTSPTCLREIQQESGVNYAKNYIEGLISQAS